MSDSIDWRRYPRKRILVPGKLVSKVPPAKLRLMAKAAQERQRKSSAVRYHTGKALNAFRREFGSAAVEAARLASVPVDRET